MSGSSKLLTTGQVAKLCGFSPSAVLQWINTKKLPAYSSPGGRHRVDPADLLEFLEIHGMHVPPELRRAVMRRVLIVDDEEPVRKTLRDMLGELSVACEIEEAASGAEGCVKVASFRPDLLVLDVKMPGVDGEDLCRYLRSSPEFNAVKVLVVTGYADDETISRMKEAGADAWLAKPVKPEEFLKAARDLLGIGIEGSLVS